MTWISKIKCDFFFFPTYVVIVIHYNHGSLWLVTGTPSWEKQSQYKQSCRIPLIFSCTALSLSPEACVKSWTLLHHFTSFANKKTAHPS